ncbi:CaiB/BaiF CoA transferase family protein [Nonomuraea thailandensis]
MRALEDVTVVSLEQYGAGPFGSVHLADLGAEIIKIEDPRVGGDVGRYVPPYADEEDSLFFETFNRNKRSISLDLSIPAGRAVFEDLVRHGDAVYSNLRGDVPAKMRLRYADLKHLNPRIVCCSLTGFGTTGPRAAEPGYDYILQGLAGWMDLTGEPSGPPAKSGLSLVDYSGGLVAAIALLAGVHAARRDGTGMDCDLSLYDTAIGMLTYVGTWALNTSYVPARTASSAHPSLVPFQSFEAADGWLVVGCAKEKFWQRLAAILDRESPGAGFAADPRYAGFEARRRHAVDLLPRLAAIFRGRSVAWWLAELRAAGIPSGPVNDVRQALREPHTAARGWSLRPIIRGTGRCGSSPRPYGWGRGRSSTGGRRGGEHTEEVVRGLLGYPAERFAELRAAGAFGHVAGESP